MNADPKVNATSYTPPAPEKIYNFSVENITQEQADGLVSIFSLIGGPEEGTARAVTSQIKYALMQQGARWNWGPGQFKARGRVIIEPVGERFESQDSSEY